MNPEAPGYSIMERQAPSQYENESGCPKMGQHTHECTWVRQQPEHDQKQNITRHRIIDYGGV